jgi:hypothetical protein
MAGRSVGGSVGGKAAGDQAPVEGRITIPFTLTLSLPSSAPHWEFKETPPILRGKRDREPKEKERVKAMPMPSHPFQISVERFPNRGKSADL